MITSNIKDIFYESGKTINELASLLDVPYTNIYVMLDRKDLKHTQLGTLIKLADALNVEVEDLYTIEEE